MLIMTMGAKKLHSTPHSAIRDQKENKNRGHGTRIALQK